jgi:hypothetical protein
MNRTRILTPAAIATGTLLTAAALPAGAAPLTYQEAVLSGNPYLYYRLGEPSGTTATDTSTNGRNGTYVNSPTLGATGFGAASDTAVSFSSNNALAPIASFGSSVPNSTYEFIVKADAANFTSAATLFGLINADPDGAGARTQNQALAIEFNAAGVNGTTTAGTARLWLRDEGSSQLWVNMNQGNLLDGNYHHFAVTVDMSAATATDKVKAYVDGLAIAITDGAESAALADAWLDFTVDAALGARNVRNTSVDRFAPVTVDEVALYTTALSATQVAANATAAGFVVPEPGALALVGVAGLGLMARRRRQA